MVWNPLDYKIGRPISGLVAGAALGGSLGLIFYDIPAEIYRAATNTPIEEIQIPEEKRIEYVSDTFTHHKTHISETGFLLGAIPGGLAGLILMPYLLSPKGRE